MSPTITMDSFVFAEMSQNKPVFNSIENSLHTLQLMTKLTSVDLLSVSMATHKAREVKQREAHSVYNSAMYSFAAETMCPAHREAHQYDELCLKTKERPFGSCKCT